MTFKVHSTCVKVIGMCVEGPGGVEAGGGDELSATDAMFTNEQVEVGGGGGGVLWWW